MTSVTLDVLAQKIDNLTENVNRGFGDIKADIKDHEDRIRAIDKRSLENEQRLGVFSAAQAAFTVLAAAVAGWFGSR